MRWYATPSRPREVEPFRLPLEDWARLGFTSTVTSCETHPNETATGACAGCGRFMCVACNRGTNKLMCRVCVEREAPPKTPPPLPAPPAPAPVQVIVGSPSHAAPVPAMRRPAPPPPAHAPRRKRRRALFWLAAGLTSWAWLSWGWLGLLAGAPLFAGVSFLKRRDRAKEEIVVFEARALDTYRALRGPTVTKDTLVRDHGFTPEDADRTLGWLAGQELLEADWTDMDGPLTYKRND